MKIGMVAVLNACCCAVLVVVRRRRRRLLLLLALDEAADVAGIHVDVAAGHGRGASTARHGRRRVVMMMTRMAMLRMSLMMILIVLGHDDDLLVWLWKIDLSDDRGKTN